MPSRPRFLNRATQDPLRTAASSSVKFETFTTVYAALPRNSSVDTDRAVMASGLNCSLVGVLTPSRRPSAFAIYAALGNRTGMIRSDIGGSTQLSVA